MMQIVSNTLQHNDFSMAKYRNYGFRPTKKTADLAKRIDGAIEKSGLIPSEWFRQASIARLESTDEQLGDLTDQDRAAVAVVRKLRKIDEKLLGQMLAVITAAGESQKLAALARSFADLALTARERTDRHSRGDEEAAGSPRKATAR